MVKFQWSDDCEKSFAEMKTRLNTTLVLTRIEDSNGYVIYCYVSIVLVGCMLMQGDKVIAYASRQFKVHEKNYSTYESSFQQCLHLRSGDTACMVFIDHKSL